MFPVAHCLRGEKSFRWVDYGRVCRFARRMRRTFTTVDGLTLVGDAHGDPTHPFGTFSELFDSPGAPMRFVATA